MAESARLAALREGYAAYNRGDFERIVEFLDEDVELVPPPNSPDPRPRRGLDEVREYIAPNVFDQQSAEPAEFIEEGDRILVIAHARARGRGSGVEIDQTVFHLWTLAGERAVRFEVHVDRERAMAALRGG
jgi:ketosteroid isomerase-like protein